MSAVIACSALAARAADLPPKVDLTPLFERQGLTARVQGNRDDCSIFAITGAVQLETARHLPGPHRRLSEEFLIWAGDKASGTTGDQAMFYKAVLGLNVHGICAEDQMPYKSKPDPRRHPSQAAVADARRLAERWQVEWIKRWSVEERLNDRELLEIKRALVNKHPVACGLRWPKQLKGSELLGVPPANEVEDGHSILFVGYEDDPRKPGGGVLIFRNSWGPKWGQNGYGVMSYAYARTYANDALWLRLEPPGAEIPRFRFEAESMPRLGVSNCTAAPQRMNDWGAKMWSRGEQLFCNAKRGGSVTLGFEVPKPGRYRLRLLATTAPDYGTIHAALDGARLPRAFDLYSGRVSPTGSLELGTHELTTGRHSLRITSGGKNPISKGFSFGLDALDLLAEK
jgi:Papain family cysteine protease